MMLGSLKIKNNAVTPRSPRPTTVNPMTAPELKAIESPSCNDFFEPSAVRVFALVAIRIPIFPANAEKIPPMMKESAIYIPMNLNNSAATITRNTERMTYSFFRKVNAP